MRPAAGRVEEGGRDGGGGGLREGGGVGRGDTGGGRAGRERVEGAALVGKREALPAEEDAGEPALESSAACAARIDPAPRLDSYEGALEPRLGRFDALAPVALEPSLKLAASLELPPALALAPLNKSLVRPAKMAENRIDSGLSRLGLGKRGGPGSSASPLDTSALSGRADQVELRHSGSAALEAG